MKAPSGGHQAPPPPRRAAHSNDIRLAGTCMSKNWVFKKKKTEKIFPALSDTASVKLLGLIAKLIRLSLLIMLQINMSPTPAAPNKVGGPNK